MPPISIKIRLQLYPPGLISGISGVVTGAFTSGSGVGSGSGSGSGAGSGTGSGTGSGSGAGSGSGSGTGSGSGVGSGSGSGSGKAGARTAYIEKPLILVITMCLSVSTVQSSFVHSSLSSSHRPINRLSSGTCQGIKEGSYLMVRDMGGLKVEPTGVSS